MTYGRVRLRWLLVLTVLLAVTPIFALYLVRLQANSDEAVRQAMQQAVALAQDGVEAHSQIESRARQFLEMVGEVPVVRSAAPSECRRFLERVKEDRSWITSIFVVDPSGKGVCGTSQTARTLDISDQSYFRDAVASKGFVLSDIVATPSTGSPIVVAVLPLDARDGTLRSVVGLRATLPWINDVAAETTVKFDGILIALDPNRQLVAYQPAVPANSTLDELTESPLISTILDPQTTMFEAHDPAGIRRIFGVAHLPDASMTVAVGLDRNAVLEPIEHRFRVDLLFLVMVALGSIGAAMLVAEFGLLRGMRALKTAALRLKAGRMGLRVKLPSFVAAELHDLAATYNAMTAEFERLAYLDRLTGLPNRRYLERYLAQRDGRSDTGQTARRATLAIDLDGFKPVNDSHGHAVGDKVLSIIARRIAAVIDDRGLLFRVGGDEFVVIVPLGDSEGRETARRLAEEVRQAMEQVIEFEGLIFPVACSVGIAIVPDDAKTPAGALVVADAALYEAKRCGRNRVVDNAPQLASETPTAVEEAKRRRWTAAEIGTPW